MCQVDKFKGDGGPVFSNTAAQGDELEWKGRSRDQTEALDQIVPVMRIYIHMEDLHPLGAQLNSSRGMCRSASEPRCHLGSSGVSLLISVDFRSSWD